MTPRRAGPGDEARVAALWIALTEHHAQVEPLFALRPGGEAEARRLVAVQLRDPDTAVFVLEAGEELCGFCTARIDRAPPIHAEDVRAEITDLWVTPPRRRAGLGRALVDAALAFVRGRGVARVEARVAARNGEGQAFWRAQGFGDFMDVLNRRL